MDKQPIYVPRPSKKIERRRELVVAFEGLLGELGYEGATIIRIAEAANLNPGLVHHYFRDKDELVEELLRHLVDKLRRRLRNARRPEELSDAVLGLGPGSDRRAARAWVGIVAEAMRRPDLRRSVRSALGRLHRALRRAGADDDHARAMLALMTGFLLLGAIDPELTQGGGAAIARRLRLD